MARHLLLQFFLPEENRFYDLLAKLGAELARNDVELILFSESPSEKIRGFRNIKHDHTLTRVPISEVADRQKIGWSRDIEALKTQSCYGLSAAPEAAERSRIFWTRWIEELRPIGVLVAEQNIPSSQVLVECCRERRIPYWHLSKGVFDDTIQLDPCGHLRYGSMTMSPSLAARLEGIVYPHSFQEIADFFLSRNLAHYPNINRDKPPAHLSDKDERPVILVLGAGNVTAMRWPGWATEISPIFGHSNEMIEWFLEHRPTLPVGCRVVFKNHPWDDTDYHHLAKHGIEWLPEVDVRSLVALAEVVVSISTIVQFECILMQKPQVILGHSELFGKGVAYEANSREEIQEAVFSCLKRKDFPAMQKRAESFVERICNVFLIGTIEGMPCGLNLESLADYLAHFKSLVWTSEAVTFHTQPGVTLRDDPEFEVRRLQNCLERTEEKYSKSSKERKRLEAKLEKLEKKFFKLDERLASQKERFENWSRKSFIYRVFHKFRW